MLLYGSFFRVVGGLWFVVFMSAQYLQVSHRVTHNEPALCEDVAFGSYSPERLLNYLLVEVKHYSSIELYLPELMPGFALS